MPESGRYWKNEAQRGRDSRSRGAEKVSSLNEQQACPYIVAGSASVVEGRRSWTCVRYRRIVGQAHCEECRLVLTRTPGLG